jgi:hypothetical protein
MTRLGRLSLIVFAAVLALGAACGGPVRERLLVEWTFAGKTCDVAGVARVRVAIAGHVLTPDTFQCLQPDGSLVRGADLGSFLTGTYSLQIDAYDAAGALTYQAAQSFEVTPTGDNHLVVDLTPQTQTTVTLRWTFAGKTCAQAGNPTVQVILDNSPTPLTDQSGNPNLPCAQLGSDGTLQDGISVYPLTPGLHTFSFLATAASGASYRLQNFPVTALSGQNVLATPNLVAGGSASACASGACAGVLWSFSGLPCSDAAVDTVRVYVDGANAGEPACADGGGTVSNLTTGSHTFQIVGFRAGVAEYTSGIVAANFSAGSSTNVAIDAAASPPGVGDARLDFQFPAGVPDCTGSLVIPIAYTLTDPSNQQSALVQASCGGGPGRAGIVFCDARVASCPFGSQPGLTPGLWTISAQTQNSSGPVYTANYSFAVANTAEWQYTLLFQ